jgi:hypothetical protein
MKMATLQAGVAMKWDVPIFHSFSESATGRAIGLAHNICSAKL